jgi:hypothetical protein
MKWKAKPKFLQECSIFFKLSKQKTQCTQNFWSVSSAFFSNTKGGSRAPAARFLDPFDTTLPSCGNSYRNLQHLRKLGPMGGQVSPDPSLASQPFSLQSGRYNAQMHCGVGSGVSVHRAESPGTGSGGGEVQHCPG